jgi:hypothetical protein
VRARVLDGENTSASADDPDRATIELKDPELVEREILNAPDRAAFERDRRHAGTAIRSVDSATP